MPGPLALLGRACGGLRAEFGAREPGSAAPAWYEPDQTMAFCIRRMAQVLRRMLAAVTR